MAYKWLPVTEDFDKTLVIKKWRFDVSIPITGNYDGALSELPNIDIKTCWNNPQPSNGYAFSNRFNLGTKYFSSRYYGWTDRYWTATTEAHTTLVSGTTYEFECPVDLYWAGNYTTPWNDNIPNYMWFYVESSTFEISPSAISATYESGTTSITVTADEEMTWTASTSDSWITLTNPTGTGNGSVSVSYSANPAFQSRTGSITFTSSDGDEITVSVEQEKKPALVYDHPIYRSGNLVKKMYRSGNLIYYRLNPEAPCLEVTPVSGSVSADGSITFAADYKPQCTRTQSQDVTNDATWSVSPSGYGSISNGVFTADNQDSASTSVTITATYSGLSDTSIVEIEGYKPEQPVTFTITSAGNIKWYAQNNSYTKTIEYKKNDGEWTQITSSNAGAIISVVAGDVVQFRGNNAQYAPQDGRCSCFSGTTCGFKLSGNIMSLVDSQNFATLSSFTANNVFMNFFNNCSNLSDASELKLPATALTNYCYQGMLAQCPYLTKGPVLPVETLVQGCYAYFYYHSSRLTEITCLATNKSASNCLQDWVNGVQTSSGTFYKNPNMSSWNRGNAGVPNNWTITDYSPN